MYYVAMCYSIKDKMKSFVYWVALKKAGWCVVAQGDVEGKIISQKASIVGSSVLVVRCVAVGLGGDNIIFQNSSIVLSFVSVFMVVMVRVAAAAIVGVLSSCSRSCCPCLSNGPN